MNITVPFTPATIIRPGLKVPAVVPPSASLNVVVRGGQPERLRGAFMSGNGFGVLRVQPLLSQPGPDRQAGERKRCFYTLTPQGQKALAAHLEEVWSEACARGATGAEACGSCDLAIVRYWRGRKPEAERLEHQGLVTSLPRKGLIVREMKVEDQFALLEVLRPVDRLVAAKAARLAQAARPRRARRYCPRCFRL